MELKGKKELVALIRARSDKFVRAVALETQKRIVQRCPVDTGRARNSFQVTRNTIPTEQAAELVNAQYDKSGAKAIADGAEALRHAGVGDVIYVTSSLPYVAELEQGSSKQAPNGMVAITAAEMAKFAADAAAKISRDG